MTTAIPPAPGPPAPGLPVPGPRGLRQVADVLAFARDPLGYLASAASEHGDVVALPQLGGHRTYLVSRPDLVVEVLRATNREYLKGYDEDWALQRLLGQGLITSEGERWRAQRRRSQSSFRPRRVEEYGAAMVEHTDRMIAGWAGRAGPTGRSDHTDRTDQTDRTRDLAADLTLLTMEITATVLFDVDLGERAGDVSRALSDAMDTYYEQQRNPFQALSSLALARFGWQARPRRFRLATERIDAAVASIVAERARRPEGSDLLGHLLAEHEDPQSAELHDEVKSLLLAGHETTANALAWTFLLLDRRPELVDRLHAEVDTTLGERPPTPGDELPLVAATLDEAMRLFPPVPIVSRRPAADVELGGHTLPAGSEVVISPWVVHRDGRWYDEPAEFRPERWLDGRQRQLSRGAYLPFADGPRVCVGNHFARLEARLLLARLLQRVSFEVVGGELRPQPAISLRPAGGLRVVATPRRGASALTG